VYSTKHRAVKTKRKKVEEVMGSFVKQLWGMDVVGFSDKFLSVDEVMEQSGLDFHVEAEPVFLADGTKVPKTKVTRNTRTKEIYGTVGDKYTILDNPLIVLVP
jgi:hypothetical protein